MPKSLGPWNASRTFLALIVVACLGYGGMLGYGAVAPRVRGSPAFDPDRALALAEAQVAFGPRITGSPGSRRFRLWWQAYFSDLRWRSFAQAFPIDDDTNGHNLIAYQGRGPALLLGAHYDSRLWADEETDRALRERPVPGANDGASGVAVLMELARVLDVARTGHTICLAFFDAEDNGRIPGWDWIMGSQAYVDSLAQFPACQEPQAVIIVDMIGDRVQEIYMEESGDARLSRALWTQAADLGYAAWFVPEVRYRLIDDHTPFLRAGIPAITVIDFDYPYWHTVSDTMDKLSRESLGRVGHVLETWLEAGAPWTR